MYTIAALMAQYPNSCYVDLLDYSYYAMKCLQEDPNNQWIIPFETFVRASAMRNAILNAQIDKTFIVCNN